MHKYLRAIGFSKFHKKKQIHSLVKNSIIEANIRNYISIGEDAMLTVYCREFFPGIGIMTCGEIDEKNSFIYDYYVPYLKSDKISTYEDITIERSVSRESYLGACDDLRVGVSLIFYLENMIDYLKIKNEDKLPIGGTSLCLSGLSVEGMIMMPINKNEKQKEKIHKRNNNRYRLIEAARRGDEKAIETLTLEDMDTYSSIVRKIQKEDVFSIVDSYFMPYGMESDQYSILGEILEYSKLQNEYTGEYIYKMTINCNELVLEVCINETDLFGEPEIGRRFKGQIWLQGYINFP